MTPKLLIPTVAAVAACALGALPVSSAAAATSPQQAASANWAGYVVEPAADGSSSGERFRSVSGSWVVPTASCTSGQGYSAFWVGLGGSGAAQASSAGTEALEQAGTEADCSASGAVSQFAWYELVPSAPVRISMPVHAGDHITTRVTVTGSQVAITMTDATTGGSFARTLTMSNPDTSSAEWVAEAPSTCSGAATGCTPLPLADFGRVGFTSATATTTSGHTGTISDPAFSATALTLSPSSSGSYGPGMAGYDIGGSGSASDAGGEASPSSLASDGSAFSVAWQSTSGSSAANDGSGDPYRDGGYGYGYGGYGYGGYGYGGDGSNGYGGYGGYGAGGVIVTGE